MRAAARDVSAGQAGNFAVVRVSDAANLCRLQATTRVMGRTAGLSEARVFEAVIAVTELAHRLFIENEGCGDVELAAIRFRHGMGLDVRAASADGAGPHPLVSARLTFAPDAGAAKRRTRRTQ